MEDHKHLGQGEGLGLQQHPGHPHHVDTEDEDIQHAAHAVQPGAGRKDETLGQNFDCQFDPHPRLKHVVGNLQLGVYHDPVVQRHKELQHHF